MSKDFEPCPFCGVELEEAGELVKYMRHPVRGTAEAKCPASGVTLEISPERDDEKIANWNRREAADALASIRAERDAAVVALKPFADAGGQIPIGHGLDDEPTSDDEPVTMSVVGFFIGDVTVADFARARAIIEGRQS